MSGLNHKAAAEVMRGAFRSVHQRDPEPRELLFCLAVAAAETSYGHGWVGKQANCRDSNNWGARQLTKGEIEKGAPGCGATDSHPDGERYEQQFKVYPSAEAGAADVVRLLTTQRPRTWEVIRDPAASVCEFSDMLRRDRYYGGFCPAASKEHGKAVQTYGDPKTPAAEACHAEAARNHCEKFIGPHVAAIAAALGVEAPPMDRSGLVGASAWRWRAGLAALFVAGGAALWKVLRP